MSFLSNGGFFCTILPTDNVMNTHTPTDLFIFFIFRQINDVEKGYYADGEDAYDMRLPFTQSESSTSAFRSMTPLKQVVAVNPTTAHRNVEDSKSLTADGDREGGVDGGGAIAAETAGGSAVDGVTEKLEGLSVGGGEV